MKTLLLVAVAGVLTTTVQVGSSRAVEAARQAPAAAQAKAPKAGSKCDKDVVSTTYAACYAHNLKMGWKDPSDYCHQHCTE
jgi:hypothetical protein